MRFLPVFRGFIFGGGVSIGNAGVTGVEFGGCSGAARGADGDGLQTAERFVDRLRVGEGVQEVGREEDNVGAVQHAVVVFAPDGFGEVKRAGFERVGFPADEATPEGIAHDIRVLERT